MYQEPTEQCLVIRPSWFLLRALCGSGASVYTLIVNVHRVLTFDMHSWALASCY